MKARVCFWCYIATAALIIIIKAQNVHLPTQDKTCGFPLLHPNQTSHNSSSSVLEAFNHLPTNEVMWLTLASYEYRFLLHELLLSLTTKIGYKPPLLVLCMDLGCTEACRSLKISSFAAYESWKPLNVNHVKLRGLMEVTKFGRPLIMLDLDIVILKNPFPYMKQLVADDWDIQFQLNYPAHNNYTQANIGWIFQKPSRPVQRLWRDCLLVSSQGGFSWWDQGIVNQLLSNHTYVESIGLKVHVLPQDLFVQLMLMGSFRSDGRLYTPGKHAYPIPSAAVIFHLTVVSHGGFMKEHVMKQLGLWSGIPDCYYQKQSKFISVGEIWNGTREELLYTMNTLLWLSNLTQRTAIMPAVLHVSTPKAHMNAWYCAFKTSTLKFMGVSYVDANYFHFKAKNLQLQSFVPPYTVAKCILPSNLSIHQVESVLGKYKSELLIVNIVPPRLLDAKFLLPLCSDCNCME